MGGSVSRRFLAAILMAGLCFGATSASDSAKEQAMALAKKARRAENAGHNADAYLLYSEASALQRQNSKYRAKMASLQSRAAAEAQAAPAALEDDAPLLSEEEVFDSLSAREYASARQLQGPATLTAKPGT